MQELSKARVTVSMDRGLWAKGKVEAQELHLSFSRYLERLIERDLLDGELGGSQLDRIEAMLDRLVPEKRGTPIYGNGVSSTKITLKDHGLSDPKVFEPVSGESIKEKKISAVKGNVRDDDEILKEAQAKIDKIKLVKAGEKLTKHDLVVESGGVGFRPMPKGGKK